MDCNKTANADGCACTYIGCSNRGLCCECLRSHLEHKELPGCCFPPKAEKTCDRSFANFARAWGL